MTDEIYIYGGDRRLNWKEYDIIIGKDQISRQERMCRIMRMDTPLYRRTLTMWWRLGMIRRVA